MEIDWIEIVTLLLGSGFVLSIVTIIYNWRQSQIEREIQDRREKTANKIQDRREATARDFEARRKAEKYYMGLYGHIAILDELARGYHRSVKNNGTAKVFTKDCQYTELSSDEILKEFQNEYTAFSSFYIKRKCKGYEIFVSAALKKSLIEFWGQMQDFCDYPETLKEEQKINDAHLIAEQTTDHMEMLFGLKEK